MDKREVVKDDANNDIMKLKKRTMEIDYNGIREDGYSCMKE